MKQRGPLCYSTTSVQWQSRALEKNLNQVEHRAASGTQKEDRTHLFPELWSTSRMSRGASLPKKSYVSDLCSNVCLFVKLISLLMKSKQRAWLTALCHKFSKVKSCSHARRQTWNMWPFFDREYHKYRGSRYHFFSQLTSRHFQSCFHWRSLWDISLH